jgi:ABC-type oligopeptide transport system ATPase subunit
MSETLLDVRGLTKDFPTGGPHGETHRAVDDVTFSVAPGEILGLVGESGSGKSTTARCILRLIEPTSGEIRLGGVDVRRASPKTLKGVRRQAQMVFQDPYSSLDPRMTVEQLVGEGLEIHGLARGRAARRERVIEVLRLVGLGERDLARLPHAFSGGQRQRIGIARALAVDPRLLVCDEPIASLDVSIRAQILNLFSDLRMELGVALLFIAHDLASVRYLCDRVAVMHHGRIVEIGTRSQIYEAPQHEYTRALLAATPIPDPIAERRRIAAFTTGTPGAVAS